MKITSRWLLLAAFCWLATSLSVASTFTPLAWQDTTERVLPQLPDRPFEIAIGFNRCIEPEEINRMKAGGYFVERSDLVSAAVLRFADEKQFLETIRDLDDSRLEAAAFQIDDLTLGHGTSARGHEAIESRRYTGLHPHERGILGRDVRIAVVDSGVDSWHIQLEDTGIGAGRWVAGYDAIEDEEGDPQASIPHGSTVAGIALGKDLSRPYYKCRSYDCVGMAPKAHLLDVKVTDSSQVRLSHVFRGLNWLARFHRHQRRVGVANLSFFSCSDDPNPRRNPLAAIANFLVREGISVVAAHGNASSCGLPSRCDGACTYQTGAPGSAWDVITVAGTDDSGRVDRAYHRPFCDGLCGVFGTWKPDLSASAELVAAPSPASGTRDSFARRSGTSIAAAHVTGAAALVKSAAPGISPVGIKYSLIWHADTQHNPWYWWDNELGWGILTLGWLKRPCCNDTDALADLTFAGCKLGKTGGDLADCKPTDGNVPLWRNTEGIRIEDAPDGGQNVVVHVVNEGYAPARAIVRLEGYDRALGNRHFYHIEDREIDANGHPLVVRGKSGVSITFGLSEEHRRLKSFRASVHSPDDRTHSDNRTQRNLDAVGDDVKFDLESPFFRDANLVLQAEPGCLVEGGELEASQVLPVSVSAESCPEEYRLLNKENLGKCDLELFEAPLAPGSKPLGGIRLVPQSSP